MIPDLSIIVPMYNEHEVINSFFKEVRKVMAQIPEYTYEIICINDGSTDNTLDVLKDYAKKDSRIKVISFSRNFHKEIAVTAGLDMASGHYVLPMDADLQHPVEMIPQFLNKIKEGYEIVYGIKKQRQGDSFIKKTTASLFYKIYHLITGLKMPHNASDFILFSRKAIEIIKSYREKNRFMRVLFYDIGLKSCYLEYSIKERVEGKTKWNYWKLWNVAIDSITSSSTLPLRIWTYIGGSLTCISFLYGLFIILRTIICGVDVPGYASLLSLILFMGGGTTFSIGAFWRIYRTYFYRSEK